MPAVGSSRKSSAGSWTSAQASSRRRCMPPDSRPARRLADVPQVDELEDLAGAPPARRQNSIPNSDADEVDVLARPSGPGRG